MSLYSENSELYEKECSELELLRQAAVENTAMDFTGLQTLKKYYCQLEFLANRFPLTSADPVSISFEWQDHMSNRTISLDDVHFEKANVLFNIGALHSLLGGMDNRLTQDGMKISCTHFQCAAWAYQQLQQHNFSTNDAACLDFNHNILVFYHLTMLAQAQECLLEKSMSDNRKSSTISRIAIQVSHYHTTASKHLNDFTSSCNVKAKVVKDWKILAEVKIKFYACIAYYYAALQSESENKWGDTLTYLTEAQRSLAELNKGKRVTDGSIDESVVFLNDIITGKYNSVKKDNDLVYHDKVLSFDALPSIQGASLVKAISFKIDDMEVSGEDIFKKLVPFKIHQSSSLYSEEKAKLLRKIGSDVDVKDDEMSKYLSMLGLNLSDDISPPSLQIPDSLLQKCALLASTPSRDVVKELVAAMSALSSRSTEVEGDLNKSLEILNNVETQIKDIYDNHGIQLGGMSECTEIKKDVNKFKSALDKSSQSSEELHKLMAVHVSNLKLLTSPLDMLVQEIKTIQYVPSDAENADLLSMKKMLEKVGEMIDQRSNLMQTLRQQLQQDDVTQKLINMTDKDTQAIFSEELEKHSKVVKIINQNLLAQSNITHNITELNSEFVPIRRKINSGEERVRTFIESLIRSCEVYDDLIAKTKNGVDFYDKVSDSISKLLMKCESLYESFQKQTAPVVDKIQAMKDKTKMESETSSKLPHNNAEEVTAVDDVDNDDIGALKDKLERLKASIEDKPGMKLKDYLPYMKPSTFGTSVTSLPQSSTSFLPTSTFPSSFAVSNNGAYITNNSIASFHMNQPPTSTFQQQQQFIPQQQQFIPQQQQYIPQQQQRIRLPQHQLPSQLPQPQQQHQQQPQQQLPQQHQQQSQQQYQQQHQQQHPYNPYQTPQPPLQQPQRNIHNTQPYTFPQSSNSSPQHLNSQHPQQQFHNIKSQQQYPQQNILPTQNSLQPLPQQQAHNLHQQPQNLTTQHYQVPPQQIIQQQHQHLSQRQQLQPHHQLPHQQNQLLHQQNQFSHQNLPSQQQFRQQSPLHQPPPLQNHQPLPQQHNQLPPQHLQQFPQLPPQQLAQQFPLQKPTQFPQQPPQQSHQLPFQGSTNLSYNNTNAVQETNKICPIPASNTNQKQQNLNQPVVYTPPHLIHQSQPQQHQAQQLPYQQIQQKPQPSRLQLNQFNQPSNQQFTTQTQQQLSQQNVNLQQKVSYSQPPLPFPQQTPQPRQHLHPSNQHQIQPPPMSSGFQQQIQSQLHLPHTQQPNLQHLPQQQPPQRSLQQDPQQLQQKYQQQNYLQQNQVPQQNLQQHQQQHQMPQQQNPPPQNSQLLQQNPQQLPQQLYFQQQPQKQSALLDTTPPALPSQNILPFQTLQQQHQQTSLQPQTQQTNNIPAQQPTNTQPSQLQQHQSSQLQHSSSHKQPSTFHTSNSHTRQSSAASLDEILSNGSNSPKLSDLLQPKVVTEEDLKRQRREEMRVKLNSIARDPYVEDAKLQKFVSDVEKLKKHVESLSKPHLNKSTQLDLEWKELNEEQERSTKTLSMAIARCYPLKNRCPDFMPFDKTRVKLVEAADDYINASHINNTSLGCPDVIATQTPLSTTLDDFLNLLYHYHIEIVVMLTSHNELNDKNLHPYWPADKGHELKTVSFQVTLQSVQKKENWTERIIYFTNNKTNLSRSLMQLEFNQWPVGADPQNMSSLLLFINHLHTLYLQQRSLMRPVVVHCSNGSGRTGSFLTIYNGVVETNGGRGVVDVVEVVRTLRRQRKWMVEWPRQLDFVYRAVLAYNMEFLMKYGILNTSPLLDSTYQQPSFTHARKMSTESKGRELGNKELQSLPIVIAATPNNNITTPIVSFPSEATTTNFIATATCTTTITTVTTTSNNTTIIEVLSTDSIVTTSVSNSSSLTTNVTNGNASNATLKMGINDTKTITTHGNNDTPTTQSALSNLQNAENFSIDLKANKRKITKANFFSQSGKLTNPVTTVCQDSGVGDDPLNSLDPLWRLNK